MRAWLRSGDRRRPAIDLGTGGAVSTPCPRRTWPKPVRRPPTWPTARSVDRRNALALEPYRASSLARGGAVEALHNDLGTAYRPRRPFVPNTDNPDRPCHDAGGVNWSGDTGAKLKRDPGQENRRFPIHVSLRQSCSWRTNMTFASPAAELIRCVQQDQLEICQTAWLSSFGIFQGSMKTFLKD